MSTPRPNPPAEDVAIARRVLADNAAVIGLHPVPPLAGQLWPVAVRLGRALRLLVTKPVGIVRAPRLTAGGAAGNGDAAYRLQEIDGWQLVELVLPGAQGLGEAAAQLERAVRAASGNFAHLVLDLDGYLPDVHELLELPDVFVTVALAGSTRERDLRAAVELLPTARHLGTLLLDPHAQESLGPER